MTIDQAQTNLDTAQQRLAETQALHAAADKALASAKAAGTLDLTALSRAENEKATAKGLLRAAEKAVEAAQLAHEDAEVAADREADKARAVAAAERSQIARAALDATLIKGSKQIAKVVQEALVHYTDLSAAVAEFKSISADSDLAAELKREGIESAFSYGPYESFQPYGPNAYLLWQLVSSEIAKRDEAERANRKRAAKAKGMRKQTTETVFIDVAGGHRRRALELLGGYAANSSFFKETGTQREVARIYFEPEHEEKVMGLLATNKVPVFPSGMGG